MSGPPRRRGVWAAMAGLVLAAIAGSFYFLKVVYVDDRRHPFPAPPTAGPLSRQAYLDWTAPPLPHRAASGERAWPSLPRLRAQHPEAQFEWVPGSPGVARVTLADPPGRVRRAALVGEDRGTYEWVGMLPSSATLEFHTGLLTNGPAMRCVVEVVDDRGTVHSVFSKRVSGRGMGIARGRGWVADPLRWWAGRSAQHEERWSPERIGLSAWGGRSVRILLRGEVSDAVSPVVPAAVLWGHPRLWFPRPERESKPMGRLVPASQTPVVMAILESGTSVGVGVDEGSQEIPARLRDLLRESVAFRRFYTGDVRLSPALATLFFLAGSYDDASSPLSAERAWPALLAGRGYRTVAVGAFSKETMDLLDAAGFEEIVQWPHDGYDPLRTSGRALQWAQEIPHRGPALVAAFFRDVPRRRWPPARFWALSLRDIPWSRPRWVKWRRAAEAAYIDDALGRLAEGLDAGSTEPLLAVLSLRGSASGEKPVRWPRTGRRGKLFWTEPGLGMRESEIRTVLALRQRAQLEPDVISPTVPLSGVGPLLLDQLKVPLPAGAGRPWVLGRARASEDSVSRVVVRASQAKALIVDGRFKYIRHGPPLKRRVRTVWFGSSAVETNLPAEEIFDLWTDPGETLNLTRSRRDLLSRLRQVLQDADPDPVEIHLGFMNPAEARMEGVVTCSAGRIEEVVSSLPISFRGPYEFSFAVTNATGSVRFRTDPPESSYMVRLVANGRPLPPGHLRVSRLGLPLPETTGDAWHDRTKFGWMDGWAPLPTTSTGPVAGLGRVSPWVTAGFEDRALPTPGRALPLNASAPPGPLITTAVLRSTAAVQPPSAPAVEGPSVSSGTFGGAP